MLHHLISVATTIALVVPPATGGWTESPTGQSVGNIYAIDSAPGALWAVGTSQLDPVFKPLALRRVGNRWVPTQQPVENSRLLDLSVARPNDVWAVGERSVPIGGPNTKPAPTRPALERLSVECRSRTDT